MYAAVLVVVHCKVSAPSIQRWSLLLPGCSVPVQGSRCNTHHCHPKLGSGSSAAQFCTQLLQTSKLGLDKGMLVGQVVSLDQPGVDAEHAGDKASNMAILDAITQKVCTRTSW